MGSGEGIDMPCHKFKLNDGTWGTITVGNEPILILVRGKKYLFELLDSGGAELVTKSGSQSSQRAPMVAWVVLQCKTAKSIRFDTSTVICKGRQMIYKSLCADSLILESFVGDTGELVDEKFTYILSVLQENGIEVSP